jgi:hypothetical protein
VALCAHPAHLLLHGVLGKVCFQLLGRELHETEAAQRPCSREGGTVEQDK